MQAIKNKWKNYRAYRRLQGLWQEYLDYSQNNNQERDRRLNEFLECFNTIALDITTQKSQQQSTEEESLPNTSQNQIGTFFTETERLIESIALFLSDKKFEGLGGQILLENISNTILTLLGDSKEMLESESSKDIIIQLIKQLGILRDVMSIRIVCKILLFQTKQKVIKIFFAQKGGYKVILGMIMDPLLPKEAKSVIMEFVKSQFDAGLGQVDSDLEQPKAQGEGQIKTKLISIARDIRDYFKSADLDLLFEKEDPYDNLSPQISLQDIIKNQVDSSVQLQNQQKEDHQQLDLFLLDAQDQSQQIETKASPPTKSKLEEFLQFQPSPNKITGFSFNNESLLESKDQVDQELYNELIETEFFYNLGQAFKEADLSNIQYLIKLMGYLIVPSYENNKQVEKQGIFQSIIQIMANVNDKSEDSTEVIKAIGLLGRLQKHQKAFYKSFDIVMCFIDILEKTKSSLVFSQCVQQAKDVFDNDIEYCVKFFAKGCFQNIQRSIYRLSTSIDLNISCLQQLLNLSNYIIYVLNELDILPTSENVVSLLLTSYQTIRIDKIQLLLSYLIGLIDDKSHRVLQSEGTTFDKVIPEIQTLIVSSLQLVRTINSLNSNNETKKQCLTLSVTLSLKCLYYQLYIYDKIPIDKFIQLKAEGQLQTSFLSTIGDISVNDYIKELINDKYLNLNTLYLVSIMLITCNGDVPNIRDKILDVIKTLKQNGQQHYIQTFLVLLFSKKHIQRQVLIKEEITARPGQIQELYKSLLNELKTQKIDKFIYNFHLLILILRDVKEMKETFDKVIDIKEFLNDSFIKEMPNQTQYFILQCLLELQGEDLIYSSEIDSPKRFNEQNLSLLVAEEFQQFMQSVQTCKPLLSIAQERCQDIQSYTFKGSSIIEEDAKLRKSNTFNLFLLVLIQSRPKAQNQIIQHLNIILRNSIENRRILIENGCQEFLLQLIYKVAQNQNNQEIQVYLKHLIELVSQLLESDIKIDDQKAFYQCFFENFECNQANTPFLTQIIQIIQKEQPHSYYSCHPLQNQQIGNLLTVFRAQINQQPLSLNAQFKIMNEFQLNEEHLIRIIIDNDIIDITYKGKKIQKGEEGLEEFLVVKQEGKCIEYSISELSQQGIFKARGFNNYQIQMNSKQRTQILINGVDITEQGQDDILSVYENQLFTVLISTKNVTFTHLLLLNKPISPLEQDRICGQGESLKWFNDSNSDLKVIDQYPQEKTHEQAITSDQTQTITRIKLVYGDHNGIKIQLPIDNLPMTVQLQDVAYAQKSENEFEQDGFRIVKHQQLPLKQFMCQKEAIQTVIDLIDIASDETTLHLALKLLNVLLIRNDIQILELFEKLKGYKKLEDILVIKECENLCSQKTYQLLIDIACNEYESHCRTESVSCLKYPRLDPHRIRFLKIPLRLIPNARPKHVNFIFLNLQQLFKHEYNVVTFREQIGFKSMIKMFQLIQSDQRFMAFYESALLLFEQFISSMKSDTYEGAQEDLQLIFDFILNQKYDISTKNVVLAIDCMSIIALHIVIEDKSKLLNKVLQLDTFHIILALFSIKNTQIKEYSFKILQLLLSKSDAFNQMFTDRKGFQHLNDCIINYGGTSFTLLQSILDAITDQFDNANPLYPTHSSLVHQIMNQSNIAGDIVNQLKLTLHRPKKTFIQYYELFQPFFSSLAQLENDQLRYAMIKEVDNLLKSDHRNMERLQDNYFNEFIDYIFVFLKKLNYRVETLNEQLLKSETTYSTNEDVKGTQERLDQQSNKLRSIEIALELMTQVAIFDIYKNVPFTNLFEFLRNYESDDLLQLQIILKMIKYFQKNPKVKAKDLYLLQNLKTLFENLDSLISENLHIIIKVMQLINSMAFKNSMDVRKQMKQLYLFELRDDLMIRCLRQCVISSDKNHDQLLHSLTSFSYETVAAKSIFREHKCIEALIIVSLQGNSQQVKDAFRKILTQEVLQYNENYKYAKDNYPEAVKYLESDQKESIQKIEVILQKLREQVQNVEPDERQMKNDKERKEKRVVIFGKYNEKLQMQQTSYQQFLDQQMQYMLEVRQRLQKYDIAHSANQEFGYRIQIA